MAIGPKEGIYRSLASSDVEMIYNVHNVQSGETKSVLLWEPVPSFKELNKSRILQLFQMGFTNWYFNAPNNGNDNQHCVWIRSVHKMIKNCVWIR